MPAHEAKLAKEYFFSYPRKIKKQKLSLPSKNKTSLPHNPSQKNTFTDYDIIQMNGLTGQARRRASANTRLAQ